MLLSNYNTANIILKSTGMHSFVLHVVLLFDTFLLNQSQIFF